MAPSFFSRRNNDSSRPVHTPSDDRHDHHESTRYSGAPANPNPIKNSPAPRGLRSSLRRLPSSLLNKLESPRRGGRSDREGEAHKSTLPPRATPTPSSFDGPAPLAEDGSKSKVKTTRKGLSGLFGRSVHPPASPPSLTRRQLGSTIATAVSPPRPLRAMPPPAEKPSREWERSNMQRLRSMASKSSFSGLSGLGSCKNQQANVKPYSRDQVMRPSMGPDPFMRAGSGAEVVEHVDRPFAVPPSTRSSVATEASAASRTSMNSGKAISSQAVVSELGSSKVTESRSTVISPTSMTFPSVTQHGPIMQPATCASAQPESTQAPLVDLPVRTTSLGRTLNNLPKHPSPSSTEVPALKPATLPLPVPVSHVEAEPRAFHRERTKSSVFSFLKRNKSRKKPNSTLPSLPSRPPPVPCKPESAVAAPLKKIMLVKPSPSERHLKGILNDKRESGKSRPPALHITRPSVGTWGPSPPASGSSVGSVRFSIQQARYVENIAATSTTSPVRRVSTASLFGARKVAATAGSTVSSPAVNEPNDTTKAIDALFTARMTMPKRKSLTGLFGLSMQSSFEHLKSIARGQAPAKSLQEEVNEALGKEQGLTVVKASPPYKSRFGDKSLAHKPTRSSESPGIRRVASATDKLSTLIGLFEVSPACTPHHLSARNGKPLPFKPSFESIKETADASPTPIRRSKSALLSAKPSSSSLRTTRVSPIKLATRVGPALSAGRQQQREPGNDTFGVAPASAVRSGARQTTVLFPRSKTNIFAPPTPVDVPQSVTPGPTLHAPAAGTPGSPCPAPTSLSARDFEAETIGMHPQTTDLRDMNKFIPAPPAGLPVELLRAVSPQLSFAPAHAAAVQALGVPPPPPSDRVTPRRPPKARPEGSLPPLPDALADQQTPVGRVSRFAPHISLDIGQTPRHKSMLGEVLSADGYARSEFGDVDETDARESFDFEAEYATLAVGTGRDSFLYALKTARPSSAFEMDHGLQEPTGVDHRPVSGVFDDADEMNTINTTSLAPPLCARLGPSPRREPFKGNPAFQRHVQQIRAVAPTAPEDSVEAVIPSSNNLAEMVAPPGHQRNASAMTMSSMGDVIETGVAGEYTNFFEANFTQHLQEHVNQMALSSIDLVGRAAQSSNGSLRSRTSSRSHHRRNSSIFSVESTGIELVTMSRDLPPLSMHNRRRPSQLMHHARGGSARSSFGAVDWARQQRRMSTASSQSSISVARLARPGLGERMFALDAGVQLASITGSPADGLAVDDYTQSDAAASTADVTAVIDGADIIDHYSQPEETEHKRKSSDSSVFSGPELNRSFRLHGARPVSTISALSSTDSSDDTHISVSRYASLHAHTPQTSQSSLPPRDVPSETPCFEARGEDESMYFTPAETTMVAARATSLSRQVLTSSLGMSRPPKPGSGGHRRRPPRLVFGGSQLSTTPATPDLTSDSASERSSRMSVDTLGSFAAGHRRQKSSKGVIPQATIREEPSYATLRPARARSGSVEGIEIPEVRDKSSFQQNLDGEQAIRAWMEWQVEAEEVCRRMKHEYQDSEEVQAIMQDFTPPTTFEEIAAFLQHSAQHYQPLPALPTARPVHTRQNSRSTARLSPYGLPLPRAIDQSAVKPKKMSIPTKYERTNSAGGAAACTRLSLGPSADNPFAPPLSAGASMAPGSAGIFARFVTNQPEPRPPIQRTNGSLPPHPLVRPDLLALPSQPKSAVPASATFAKPPDVEKRIRVPSATRRQNLGWGKRKENEQVRLVPDLPGPVRAAVMKLEEEARQKKQAEKMHEKRRPLSEAPNRSLQQQFPLRNKGKGKDKEAVTGALEKDKENVIAKKTSQSKLRTKKAPKHMASLQQSLRV